MLQHRRVGAPALGRRRPSALARRRPGAPAPTAAGPGRLVGPARRRPGAGALERRRPGAPAPWRRHRLGPPAGTVGAAGGGEIKSLHDKPNGSARAAMIGAITQKLRRNYADYAQITQKLRRLRRNYAYITQKLRMLRRNYAEITQKLRKNYAKKITQKLRVCV